MTAYALSLVSDAGGDWALISGLDISGLYISSYPDTSLTLPIAVHPLTDTKLFEGIPTTHTIVQYEQQ